MSAANEANEIYWQLLKEISTKRILVKKKRFKGRHFSLSHLTKNIVVRIDPVAGTKKTNCKFDDGLN